MHHFQYAEITNHNFLAWTGPQFVLTDIVKTKKCTQLIYVSVHHRMVEQTSVHEVLKIFGGQYKVPPDVCRIIHVRVALQNALKLEELKVDKRLWDFSEKLIRNVDKRLKSAGLLGSQGQS